MIVLGKIRKINKSDFVIDIEDMFLGSFVGSGVRIKKFEDWACAARYSKYAIGQEALFFLKRTSEDKKVSNSIFTVIGSANEGEWELRGGKILDRIPPRSLERSPLTGSEGNRLVKRTTIDGSMQTYFADYDKKSFLDAIQSYPKCFQIESGGIDSRNRHMSQTCTASELEKFIAQSPSHQKVAEELLILVNDENDKR